MRWVTTNTHMCHLTHVSAGQQDCTVICKQRRVVQYCVNAVGMDWISVVLCANTCSSASGTFGSAISIGRHQRARSGVLPYLCAFGCCVDWFLVQNGMTALHHASANGHADVVARLIAESRLLVNATDNSGNTALHWAVDGRHAVIMEQLLAAPSVDPNVADAVCTPFLLPPICSLFDDHLLSADEQRCIERLIFTV